MGLNLDIRVEPIALTHDQCVELELPRTPIKKEELRAANFEARFGTGATELDSLEALHPGKLEEMVEEWIASYRDDTLQDRIDEIETNVENEIYPINDEVHGACGSDRVARSGQGSVQRCDPGRDRKAREIRQVDREEDQQGSRGQSPRRWRFRLARGRGMRR